MINFDNVMENVLAAVGGGAIIYLASFVIKVKIKLKKHDYDLDQAFEKIRKYHPEERNGGSRIKN